MDITIPVPYSAALVPTLPADSSDAAILRQVGDQLREQGLALDLTGVLHTRPGRSSRSLLLMGSENDILRYSPETLLFHLGWSSDPVTDMTQAPKWSDFLEMEIRLLLASEVRWDVGRSTTLLEPETAESRETSEGIWPEGRSVRVTLLELSERGRHDRHETRRWAVVVGGQLAGLTGDPAIIDRVRDGEVTNLDGLTLDAEVVHVPVLRPLMADSVIATLEGQKLQPMGVLGVDSGQMMILDAGAEEHFVDNRPDFTEGNDSLSYAGACSTTTRRSHYGGVLSHQGTPRAGVSSSGYGDGAYPAYVTDKTDAVLVSFMLHEVADIDADEETLDEAIEVVNDESELDTEVLVRNAERLTWIDGGTFVVEDTPGGADVIIGDPCYMKDGHADMSLMTQIAVHPGTYQLSLGVNHYGEVAGSWEADRVSLMLAHRLD